MGPLFTRLFKGETIPHVFHNLGSSEGNEARRFTARQVYDFYAQPGFRVFFFLICDSTVELRVE